jgi:hypothetical protein
MRTPYSDACVTHLFAAVRDYGKNLLPTFTCSAAGTSSSLMRIVSISNHPSEVVTLIPPSGVLATTNPPTGVMRRQPFGIFERSKMTFLLPQCENAPGYGWLKARILLWISLVVSACQFIRPSSGVLLGK